jgi:uncharacterized repeat protein (TIGR03847 family)
VPDIIDLGLVDRCVAGAIGPPGQRTFLLQSRGARVVTVLLEKQQVSLLAQGVVQLLDQVAVQLADGPEDPVAVEAARLAGTGFEEPHAPMFRARQVGIGFDRATERILVELHEWPEGDGDDDEPDGGPADDSERRVLRLQVSRVQARALALGALEAVRAGRPICPLCQLPRDPDGHRCPAVN